MFPAYSKEESNEKDKGRDAPLSAQTFESLKAISLAKAAVISLDEDPQSSDSSGFNSPKRPKKEKKKKKKKKKKHKKRSDSSSPSPPRTLSKLTLFDEEYESFFAKFSKDQLKSFQFQEA